MDKFSKTLSLPVNVWAKLEEARSIMHAPDISVTLEECINAKHQSLMIIKLMHEKGIESIEHEIES